MNKKENEEIVLPIEHIVASTKEKIRSNPKFSNMNSVDTQNAKLRLDDNIIIFYKKTIVVDHGVIKEMLSSRDNIYLAICSY